MNQRFFTRPGTMRITILLVYLLAIVGLGPEGLPILNGDEPTFPYQAFILRDGALVRSGPGEAHYATDELQQGEAVEVYRHDPDGWCAIRPTGRRNCRRPRTGSGRWSRGPSGRCGCAMGGGWIT